MINIRDKIFSDSEFVNIITASKSKSDACKNLGFHYTNGGLFSDIEKAVVKLDLSIEHFDSKRRRIIYPAINKECPVCKVIFITQQDHPKEKTTCSRKCSNTFFSSVRQSEISNAKRSNSLSQEKENKLCHSMWSYICND